MTIKDLEHIQRLMISSGSIEPSTKRYFVTHPHKHASLLFGDVVVMVETPNMENVFLKVSDLTLHKLTDSMDQYVHVAELIE